jgi:hypothetical protein
LKDPSEADHDGSYLKREWSNKYCTDLGKLKSDTECDDALGRLDKRVQKQRNNAIKKWEVQNLKESDAIDHNQKLQKCYA